MTNEVDRLKQKDSLNFIADPDPGYVLRENVSRIQDPEQKSNFLKLKKCVVKNKFYALVDILLLGFESYP